MTVHATFVGAYNATQAMTGGNLTSTGAYVVVDESVGMGYAAYAILNVSTPSHGHLFVTLQAAELRVLAIHVAATGSFPVAGNYSANATPPLTPMNVSLAATVVVLDAYRAYVNLTTGPNGSVSLNDEHVRVLRGVNISLAAMDFPNVTTTVGGGHSIKYTTGAIVVRGWVAEDLSANFTPALRIVEGPLHVGKNWTTNPTVRFQGTVAYASLVAVQLPNGVAAQQMQSGSATLNATANVSLVFTVIGVKTVYDAEWASGERLRDRILRRPRATAGSRWRMDFVLPAADPTHPGGIAQSVPSTRRRRPWPRLRLRPARALLHATWDDRLPGGDARVRDTSRTASPMSPSNAKLAMQGLGAPGRSLRTPPSGSILGVLGDRCPRGRGGDRVRRKRTTEGLCRRPLNGREFLRGAARLSPTPFPPFLFLR